MTRDEWDTALLGNGDMPGEPDEDRDRRRVCEWEDCQSFTSMTDDFCPPHQQESDDQRSLSDEPDRWTLDAWGV